MPALLVIDMQAGMMGRNSHPVALESFIRNINQLATAFRQAKHSVIFVQHEGDPGTPFAPQSDDWQFLPEIERHSTDIGVSKTTCDAFFQTKLAETLHGLNIRHLVICGWATDFCVDTTVRAAISHQLDVTVASDAHTAANRSHLDAASIIEHHNKTWPDILTSGTQTEVATTIRVVQDILNTNIGHAAMLNGLHIVERFAKALDMEDYAGAESLLGDECEYTCRGERHYGPIEIIASYQGNGNVAKSFDAVEYESEVVIEPTGQFRIRFTDHLTHGGRQLTFRCEQLIKINESGKIVRIEHFDLLGQTEALTEFKKLLVDRNPEVG